MEVRQNSGGDTEHVLDLLSPFVDGEISADETRHIERHVAVCSLCASQLAFLRAASRTVRRAADMYPSPALFERIARATYQKPTVSQRVFAFLRPTPVRLSLGGALAAGLVAAVVLPGRFNVAPPRTPGGGLVNVPAKAVSPSPAPQTPSLPSAVVPSATGKPLLADVMPLVKPAPTMVKQVKTLVASNNTVAPPAGAARQNKAVGTSQPVAAVRTPKAQSLAVPHLSPTRKPVQMAMLSPVSNGFRNELSARSASPASARLTRPETQTSPVAAVITPAAPIRPETREAVIEAPASNGAGETVAAVIAPAPRFERREPRFSLKDAGTANYNQNSTIAASLDRSGFAAQDGVVKLVSAPVK